MVRLQWYFQNLDVVCALLQSRDWVCLDGNVEMRYQSYQHAFESVLQLLELMGS
jgi:hypothetical protein